MEFTAESPSSLIDELKDSLSQEEVAQTKEEKATLRKVKKQVKELEKHRNKLNEYNQTLE